MWDTKPGEADWQKLVDRILSADTILLVAHVEPDGDALGSVLALGLGLRSLGRRVVVSYPEMELVAGIPRLPRTLRWIPGQDLLVPPGEVPDDADLAISCDASSEDRVGELIGPMRSAGVLAVLDHHPSYTGFGDLSLVDPDAPAAAVLVLELLDLLGVELTREIAECIYAGVSTDTGSFRFGSTTAETHELAARLHRAGIAHDRISAELYDTRSLAEQRLLGLTLLRAMLETVELDSGGSLRFVWSHVTAADRGELGLGTESAEPLIGVLRRTMEADMAAVIKEQTEGDWRVSLRSRGGMDVGSLAFELGGGGHRLAAGYPAHGALVDVVAGLRAALTRRRTDDVPH
ncbi:MAG: bifunctional oligoribonuclease/PAP phosphatase NrnA [Candidatus Nanopelagicales bacterium]|nr:bifunctional oligoribonuclease/PAP phosphatase NrnA [Candidatus Nanopelagicales bacterium]